MKIISSLAKPGESEVAGPSGKRKDYIHSKEQDVINNTLKECEKG
jgi:hypothetical protein